MIFSAKNNIGFCGNLRREFAIPIGRNFRLQTYWTPGKYLSDQKLNQMHQDLCTVARRIFNGVPAYGIFRQDRMSSSNRIISILYDRRKGIPIAYLATVEIHLSWNGQEQVVYNFGNGGIDPQYQKLGISFYLYVFPMLGAMWRQKGRPCWVCSVTQVPLIMGRVADTLDHVFPHYRRLARPSAAHLALARALMRDHRHEFGVGEDAKFDEEHFIIRNSYTGGSGVMKKRFEDCAMHYNQACNHFCNNSLDYDRGDDFLQIGKVSMRTVVRSLKFRFPVRKRGVVQTRRIYQNRQ